MKKHKYVFLYDKGLMSWKPKRCFQSYKGTFWIFGGPREPKMVFRNWKGSFWANKAIFEAEKIPFGAEKSPIGAEKDSFGLENSPIGAEERPLEAINAFRTQQGLWRKGVFQVQKDLPKPKRAL